MSLNTDQIDVYNFDQITIKIPDILAISTYSWFDSSEQGWNKAMKTRIMSSFKSNVWLVQTPSLYAMNAHYSQLIYHLTTNNELRIKQIKLKICMFTAYTNAQFHRVYCFKRIVFHSFFSYRSRHTQYNARL